MKKMQNVFEKNKVEGILIIIVSNSSCICCACACVMCMRTAIAINRKINSDKFMFTD